LMRNLFDSGFLWADQAGRVLVLWVALCGASRAGRNGRHIRIELLNHWVPEFWHDLLDRITFSACAVISGVVGWYSAHFVYGEFQYGDMAFAHFPLWACELIIPITFVVLALRFFLLAIAPHHHPESHSPC